MSVDMFMKVGDITGESMDNTYAEYIDVLAWSWGASQSGSMHIGGGGGSGKVSIQDISFTKYQDSATTALFLACCNGKHYPDAQLIVRKAGENPVEYLKVSMEEVLISSYSTGGSGGEDRLTENVTLNFAKVKVEYTPQGADGSAGATMDVGWDIQANVKL